MGLILEEARARKEHEHPVDHLTKGRPEEINKDEDKDDGGNETVLLDLTADLLKTHPRAERQEGSEDL